MININKLYNSKCSLIMITEDVNELEKFYKDEDFNVRECIAQHSLCPSYILDYYKDDVEWFVRYEVASNKNTSKETLDYIYNNDKNIDVRNQVLANPNCPQEIILDNYQSFITKTKILIASNPSLSIDIFNYFSNDSSYQVRQALVLNENCPSYILDKLSIDIDEDVKIYIAAKENCPSHVLERLSKDKYYKVLEVVSSNKKTPIHCLELLSKSNYHNVRNNAKRLIMGEPNE